MVNENTRTGFQHIKKTMTFDPVFEHGQLCGSAFPHKTSRGTGQGLSFVKVRNWPGVPRHEKVEVKHEAMEEYLQLHVDGND